MIVDRAPGPEVAAESTDGLTIVDRHLQFPKARLVQPNASGYLHVAAEIDRIWPFGCVVIELEDCRPTAPAHDAVKVALETPLG